jgi:hypothetical protein
MRDNLNFKFRPARLIFVLILFCISLNSNVTKAQGLNSKWKEELAASLEQFMQCGKDNESTASCAGYTGKALTTLYKVNDFYSQQSGRYMTASEITKYLQESEGWENFGHPYDQKILDKAQQHANSRKAVVAVYQNSQGIGHVVVITPGSLQPSGSWGLKVPNAASFFASDPHRSFIDKALSFAFAKTMLRDVTIYGRL